MIATIDSPTVTGNKAAYKSCVGVLIVMLHSNTKCKHLKHIYNCWANPTIYLLIVSLCGDIYCDVFYTQTQQSYRWYNSHVDSIIHFLFTYYFTKPYSLEHNLVHLLTTASKCIVHIFNKIHNINNIHRVILMISCIVVIYFIRDFILLRVCFIRECMYISMYTMFILRQWRLNTLIIIWPQTELLGESSHTRSTIFSTLKILFPMFFLRETTRASWYLPW